MSDIKFAKIECTDPTHSVHGKSVEWHPRYGVGTVISFDSGRASWPYEVKVLEVNGYTIKCAALSKDPWGLWERHRSSLKAIEKKLCLEYDISPIEWQEMRSKVEQKAGISKTSLVSQNQIDKFNRIFQCVFDQFIRDKASKCEEIPSLHDPLEELGVICEDSNFEEKAEADYCSLRGEKSAPRIEVGHGFALKAAQTAWDLLEANKKLRASKKREKKLSRQLSEAMEELETLRKMVE